jgi:dipeptidyl aminopeptidase/acylaminoacyl peptidase
VNWLITGIGLLIWIPVTVALFLTVMYFVLSHLYVHNVLRIFVEKPIFIVPRGERPADAEDVELKTRDGFTLRAGYLKTKAAKRQGVIWFGLEYGANRWSCMSYVGHLLDAGYDIFTAELRSQGDSDVDPTYEPLQWVTDKDVADCQTAIDYLKRRPDADPRGVGFYGISKGGGAGMVAAATDPFVRCAITDGAFGTYSVVVPYMRYWFSIYNTHYMLHGMLKPWYYGLVGKDGLKKAGKDRGVTYVKVEKAVRRFAPRPWFIIHGEKDSYIRPSMAKALYDAAREPKDFWLVPGARHNQALEVAGEEYMKRVREFFDEYLANKSS